MIPNLFPNQRGFIEISNLQHGDLDGNLELAYGAQNKIEQIRPLGSSWKK